MRNIGLKLLAISSALILYFFVHSQTNSSVISLVVPVELRNLPKDRVVLLPALQQAQVTIKGPSFLLREVAISAPVFRINLPGNITDRYELALTGDDLNLPAAIEIVNIVPPRLDLILDQVVSKEVPIEVPKLGSLPADMQLLSMQIDPKIVKVSGPETELRGLNNVQSQPINLTGLNGKVELKLGLVPAGAHVKFSTDIVKVLVDVDTLITLKTFEAVTVELQGANVQQIEIMPRQVEVTVAGPASQLESLESKAIKLFVTATPEKIATGEVMVEAQLPAGFEVREIKPAKLKFVHKRIG